MILFSPLSLTDLSEHRLLLQPCKANLTLGQLLLRDFFLAQNVPVFAMPGDEEDDLPKESRRERIARIRKEKKKAKKQVKNKRRKNNPSPGGMKKAAEHSENTGKPGFKKSSKKKKTKSSNVE